MIVLCKEKEYENPNGATAAFPLLVQTGLQHAGKRLPWQYAQLRRPRPNSTGSMEHVNHFMSLRPNSTVISFDVPKWLDEMVQEFAIPQKGYNKNPLNMKGMAPKIVDPTTPGLSYELPSEWAKWFQQNYIKGSVKVK